jgi:hypothetical protein
MLLIKTSAFCWNNNCGKKLLISFFMGLLSDANNSDDDDDDDYDDDDDDDNNNNNNLRVVSFSFLTLLIILTSVSKRFRYLPTVFLNKP